MKEPGHTSSPIVKGIAVVAVAFIAAAAGYYIGVFHGIEIHAVEESKLAELALSERDEIKLTPQLKEYLKGRLYWNSAHHMGQGYVSGLLKDYGPVELNHLGGVIYMKDPTSSDSEIREVALGKMKR